MEKVKAILSALHSKTVVFFAKYPNMVFVVGLALFLLGIWIAGCKEQPVVETNIPQVSGTYLVYSGYQDITQDGLTQRTSFTEMDYILLPVAQVGEVVSIFNCLATIDGNKFAVCDMTTDAVYEFGITGCMVITGSIDFALERPKLVYDMTVTLPVFDMMATSHVEIELQKEEYSVTGCGMTEELNNMKEDD